MTNTLIERLQNGGSLALRFGHLSPGSFNGATSAYAVTGILPAGLASTFSLTGGVIATDWQAAPTDVCRRALMLGAGGDIRLYASAFGTMATSPLVTVSLDGQLGYNDATSRYVSGYVAAPIALVARGNGMQFVPFHAGLRVCPGVGERLDEQRIADADWRRLGIYNTSSNVTVNVGFQHPFITDGQTMFGCR